MYLKFGLFILAILFVMNVVNANDEKGTSMKEGFIQVTGGKIWYKIIGAEKTGIPIIAIHGGPGAPHDYMENLALLSDKNPVLFYDQLGCGLSDRSNDTTLWNVDRFVEEIKIIREELNLKEVHLLGQSWGTMLAVEYYLKYKDNGVKSLILSGPFLNAKRFGEDVRKMIFDLPEKYKNIILISEEKKDFSNAEYQEAMNYFYQKHVCRINPFPEAVNRTFEKMGIEVYNHMWGASEFSIFGVLKDRDLTDKLNEIDIPVLLTCGEYDEVTPETTKHYADKIINSEMVIFKDASHMHNLEKEEEYIKTIKIFLEKVGNN